MRKLVEPQRCTHRRQVLRQIEKITVAWMQRGSVGPRDPVLYEMYNRLLVGYDERLREMGE